MLMQLYHSGMKERYLSRQEAAIMLGVPVAVVDRLIATGALPRYRLRDRYVRVREGDVAELAHVPRDVLARC